MPDTGAFVSVQVKHVISKVAESVQVVHVLGHIEQNPPGFLKNPSLQGQMPSALGVADETVQVRHLTSSPVV